jgi:FkbM family methyltransferase
VILNTPRLFQQLLRVFRIDTVCDVGSRDGADAIRFRAVLPNARIVAFEPNPSNHEAMRGDQALAEAEIEVHPVAVAESDGVAQFFVVPADYSTSDFQRGLSSLYQRPAERDPQTPVFVPVTRLDTFFADHPPHMRVALWIDVEGKACEVLEGAADILDAVHVIHVEVETAPIIAPGQRLYADVRALLHARGFVEIAASRPQDVEQFNVVFVPRSLSSELRLRVRWWVSLLRIRHLASRVKNRLLDRGG